MACPCVEFQIKSSRLFSFNSSNAQAKCYALIGFGYDSTMNKQVCLILDLS